MVNRHYKRS